MLLLCRGLARKSELLVAGQRMGACGKKKRGLLGEDRATISTLEISNLSTHLVGRTSPRNEDRVLDAVRSDLQGFPPD